MAEHGCDLVHVNGEMRERCPGRAEFTVRSLDDVLLVCVDHRGWALERLGDTWTRVDLLRPDEWPSGWPGRWTTRQAAEHCGVSPATYRDYVSDGRAPAPFQDRDPATGAKLHDAAAVKSWHASRPGQGARTDLSDRRRG